MAAESISTPRITSAYLDSFTNRTVRLTGKVVQLRGEQATIDCEGIVTAHLNRVCCPSIYLSVYLLNTDPHHPNIRDT